ncbi:MAG: OadG family protein, partial [Paramuribaculum sp.]|nr:OadG family protein [Paramuribaculum sp.]
KTLIDEVTVPASLAPNTTYARSEDGTGEWEVRDGSGARHVTPSSANVIRDTNSKVEMFAERDENGFGMTVMAMCIVFSALLLLSVCFYVISKIGEHYSKGNKAKSHGAKLQELTREERPDSDSGEAIAAIALALHEHLDAHDRENTVLTINKVRKAYSPWNSKIYNMRQAPRH